MRILSSFFGLIAIGMVMVMSTVGSPGHAKTASHIVTAEMRANALANVERYEWAKAQQERAINAARKYAEMLDEELWRMVPSQWVPRTAGIHTTAGCPNCGEELFTVVAASIPDRYSYNHQARPWKLQCRNCQTAFPSNDYGAYYESGLDDRGEFDPDRADAALLFNPDHPDPADPDHRKWVDDGFGLTYGDETLTFIAYYTFKLWRECISAARTLAYAYALTSDPLYAHKAGVLVDRFADIYPNIDYSFVARNGWGISDGGSRKGMIQGRIWETWTAEDLSYAYDVCYEAMLQDTELIAFTARMREQYPGLDAKPDAAALTQHIEDNLVTLFCEAVIDENIAGNVGMTQEAMGMSAIALDDPVKTERYLDWLFEPGGGMIPTILVDLVTRDGPSFEGAPGYSTLTRSLIPVADLLRTYAGYDKHDLYRDYPKMKQVFMAAEAFRVLGSFTPAIGDSSKSQLYGETRFPVDELISGFRAYGGADLAQQIWHSAGNDVAQLEKQLDIFDEEPQKLIDDLVALKPPTPVKLRSVNNSGYGLAILQPEDADKGCAAFTYYGRTAGSHPHLDRLSLGIFFRTFVMNPDLGYPEYTGRWPKRHAWTKHTASHNTVLVNDRQQLPDWSGKTDLFIGGDLARLSIIDGGPVYENVITYRRATGLIDVPDTDSYVVDVFWVRGGSNHRMINNGSGQEVTHENLALVHQPTGTFAGPDIPFATPLKEPGVLDFAQEYHSENCAAFSYMYDVYRGNATSDSSWVDWKIVRKDMSVPEDRSPHLRMYPLSEVDEIAITRGDPPHHRYPDNYLRYVVRSRLGDDLESQFVTVLEPYEPDPFIASAHSLPLDSHDGEGFAAAVQVELLNGDRDITIIAENPGRITVAGVTLEGQFGFIRLRGDQVVAARMARGTSLRYRDFELTTEYGELSGTLTGFDASDWRDNLLRLSTSVTPDGVRAEELIGNYIIVRNSERSCGCYPIRDVRDNGMVISLGDKTLVERFVDPNDYEQGVVYNVAEGDEFMIATSAQFLLAQPD